MKIVIVNDFSNSNGGATYLANLNAILLKEKGHDVTYISGDSEKNLDFIARGIVCFQCHSRPITPERPWRGLFSGLFNIPAYKQVKQWIKQNDTPDTVYHLHTWSKIFSPSIFQALEQVSQRLLVHAHDYFLACPNGAFFNYHTRTRCHLRPGSLQCALSRCDQRNHFQKIWRLLRHKLRETLIDFRKNRSKVVLINHKMQPFFMLGKFSNKNIYILPNPIQPYVEQRVYAENNKAFFYVGRVVPEKGVDVFLAAAHACKVPAFVIGDGASLNGLKDKYPECTYTGWLDREQMRKYLALARAVVVSSINPEPFGLVAAEAIASGIPVIISDNAALTEDILSIGAGSKFQPGNVDALADLMQMISVDHATVLKMSHSGYERWQELAMTFDDWITRLIEEYKKLAPVQ